MVGFVAGVICPHKINVGGTSARYSKTTRRSWSSSGCGARVEAVNSACNGIIVHSPSDRTIIILHTTLESGCRPCNVNWINITPFLTNTTRIAGCETYQRVPCYGIDYKLGTGGYSAPQIRTCLSYIYRRVYRDSRNRISTCDLEEDHNSSKNAIALEDRCLNAVPITGLFKVHIPRNRDRIRPAPEVVRF